MRNNVLNKLTHELYWRCCDLQLDDNDTIDNMIACLKYAKENGIESLLNEKDDTRIWDYKEDI